MSGEAKQPQLGGDFLKLTTVFVNHALCCVQCSSGNCCEMGDALLTGIGLAAVREQESLGFAFKTAPFASERREQRQQQISIAASSIAGALWDDRDRTGSLAEQLHRVAFEPSHGTDGDLSDSDRSKLRDLAVEAEARNL